MRMLFVAGPYFGDGRFETIEANIQTAKKVAIELANAGVPFFCPHIHTSHFQVDALASESFYRSLAKHILVSACDAVYLLSGWENSTGTLDEIVLAKEHGMHVFLPVELEKAKAYCLR